MMSATHIPYTRWHEARFKEIELSHNSDSATWIWVLDGSAYDDLPSVLKQLDQESKLFPLYMGTYDEKIIQTGPWYLHAFPNSALTNWIFTQLETIPLGILISVKKEFVDNVFEHLQACLECYLTTDSGNTDPALFRFYDPRILYGLANYSDESYLNTVKGPIQSLHAWEPGRCQSLDIYHTENVPEAQNPPITLPEDLIYHLWQGNKVHTVIGTLGGVTGAWLRSKSLPLAYDYVDEISRLLEESLYSSPQDLGFATACSFHEETGLWKEIIQYVIHNKLDQFASLGDAYKFACEQSIA